MLITSVVVLLMCWSSILWSSRPYSVVLRYFNHDLATGILVYNCHYRLYSEPMCRLPNLIYFITEIWVVLFRLQKETCHVFKFNPSSGIDSTQFTYKCHICCLNYLAHVIIGLFIFCYIEPKIIQFCHISHSILTVVSESTLWNKVLCTPGNCI